MIEKDELMIGEVRELKDYLKEQLKTQMEQDNYMEAKDIIELIMELDEFTDSDLVKITTTPMGSFNVELQ